MPANSLLRASFDFLGATQHLHRACNPNHLAAAAQRRELTDGVILNPTFHERATYLPYAAARPVAACTQGARKTGFAASACWGASLATSMLRTDIPLMQHYYCTYLHDVARPAAPLPPPARPTDGEAQAKERAAARRAKMTQLGLALPRALCVGEMLLGTGARVDTAQTILDWNVLRPVSLTDFEQVRRVGCGGFIESLLLERADATQGVAALALEAAAVGMRLMMLPGRVTTGCILATAAGMGACLGLVYEACAQLVFALRCAQARARGAARVVPTHVAQARQDAQQLIGLRLLDDTQLPASLIHALWEPQAELHGPAAFNIWTRAAAAGSAALWLQLGTRARWDRRRGDTLVPAAVALMVAFKSLLRPWPVQGAQQAGPYVPEMGGPRPAARDARPNGADAAAADAARRGVDVHASGRDAATRRAVARLLQMHANIDEAASIQSLLAVLERQREQQGPLQRRRHETGISIIEAAQRALGTGAIGAGGGGFNAILTGHASHGIYLDDGRRVSTRRVCATVWHAIAHLEAGDGPDGPLSLILREERQDAFIVALADVLNRYDARVCASGQVQRMMLVLQGCIAGIDVENYEEVPSLAQMVTYVYQQLATAMPEDAAPDEIRMHFDRAYAAGVARLPEPQHASFAGELTTLAEMDYDYEWAPAATA